MNILQSLTETFLISNRGHKTVRNSVLASAFFIASALGLKQVQDHYILPPEEARTTATYHDIRNACMTATITETYPAEILQTITAGCEKKALSRAQNSASGFKAAELGISTSALLAMFFLISAYLAVLLPRYGRRESPPSP
jgi:hypothetical protein